MRMNTAMRFIPCNPNRAIRWQLLSALLCASLMSTSEATAEDWEFSVTPYLWAISTELDTRINLPGGGQQDFSDILDKLDFAAQVNFEAHKGKLGFLVNATNLQTSDRVEREAFDVDTDATTNLLEAAVLLTAIEGDGYVARALIGTRITGNELDLTIRDRESGDIVREASSDATLTDFMFGMRFEQDLSENWRLIARGDVATGDTDFTWNVSFLAGRRFGDSGMLVLGYRHLDIDFDNGTDLQSPNLAINGPIVGYSFEF